MAGRKDLHFPPRSLDQAGRQDRKQSQYQICSRPQRRQWVCELEQRAGLPADLKTNPQAFGRSLSIGMRHDQVRAEADEPAHWVRIPVQNRTIDIRGDNFIEPCRAKGSSIKSQNLVALALRQELVARHFRRADHSCRSRHKAVRLRRRSTWRLTDVPVHSRSCIRQAGISREAPPST